jgi:hypothetical protein
MFYIFVKRKKPNILYFISKGKIIRLNKLLQIYTNEECIQKQFVALLQTPLIIQNKEITLIVLETIYLYSFLFNIDLSTYIKNSSLNNLINYYLYLTKTTPI